MKYNIIKCVCCDMTFEDMKKVMKMKNIHTIEELIEKKIVASNCRLCIPYITKMIDTGQTKFEMIIN